ncbi:GatB/YqeY domain-containing protein [Taibaiella helva]|uniref:GatB/YqeY domain-containing protein n=1 Tax=Taibaiella helva TaxID=2301235 RepID=UPI0018E56936|nr:GatB/YqeY domain-containing protein [Taibaiella helva]
MNTLESKVMDQLKQAMRSKDEAALRTLRAIKAAILVEKTAAGAKDELTEADELKLLQKLVKQRKDSLEIFRTQKREDLAKTEEEEIAIIEQFLPKQLSEAELEAQVREIIAAAGASSPADMGKVMGVASRQLAGKADGKAISEMVKKILAS